MDKFFDTEGPIMLFLGKVADLIWLNILMMVCCIPVITAGASITAMYSVTIKMAMKEDGYITKGFFNAFKRNFKQATISWIIVLLAAILFYGDYRIIVYAGSNFPKIAMIILIAVLFVAYSTYLYIFPLLARYENTLKNTFKNAFLLSISNFPKTLVIVAIQLLPIIAIYISEFIFPIVFLMSGAVVAYLSSLLFVTIFKKIEGNQEVGDNN